MAGFLRPELAQTLTRSRELIAALAVLATGLWLAWLGGYLLVPLGLLVAAMGAALTRLAWRRMRFVQATTAPGLVELDEAQLAYLGPEAGGYLSLDEVMELRLIRIGGQRMWRLKQADGQALLIPVAAQGAAGLFDAFAALPGMDTAALVAAVSPAAEAPPDIAQARLIWCRPGARLPRPGAGPGGA